MFTEQIPNLGSKFAGSIIGTSCSALLPFLLPPFSDVFDSGVTTLDPCDVLRGKIWVTDWSVLELGTRGAVAQTAVFGLVERLCLSRPQGCDSPVGLFRDEAAWLIGNPEWSARFMAVARSHRCACFDYVQNLPVMQSAFTGGERGEQEAEMFIAAHANVFCFANNCPKTNQHFSGLFGMGLRHLPNYQVQPPRPESTLWDHLFGPNQQVSFGMGAQLYPKVAPEDFANKLRTGGKHNGYLVDAYFHQAGGSGRKVTFKQVLL
jgi:hypothetical protein